MNLIILLLSLTSTLSGFFYRITEMNHKKEQAEKAFIQGKYSEAARHYKLLYFKFRNKDEKIILNLAHALYKMEEFKAAENWYLKLSESKDSHLRSICYNQTGIIAYITGNTRNAFKYFRMALLEDPENLAAVYNLELLKKSEKPKDDGFVKTQTETEETDGSDKNLKGRMENPDGQRKKKEKSSEGTFQGERNPTYREKGNNHKLLQEKKNSDGDLDLKTNSKGDQTTNGIQSTNHDSGALPYEKAVQLLESMKNEEIIYLQQLKHKSEKSKKNIPNY